MKTTPILKLIIFTSFLLTAFGFSCNKEETSLSGSGERDSPSILGIYCSSTAFSATPSVGVAFSGTARVPYNGGNGAAYKSVTFSSYGVAGLTATLQTGTLNNSTGNLIFTISGTAAISGIAFFVLGFGGQTCTLQLIVNN